MDHSCGRMTDSCRRRMDKVAAAHYVGQRWRIYSGMMQSSTDTGEDNGK